MDLSEHIKNLYQQAKELNADCVHVSMEKILRDDTASAVISVYVGKRPSHLVLEELYEWAEKNDNKELMDKMEALEGDLSFIGE